jgi:hypothetical protein
MSILECGGRRIGFSLAVLAGLVTGDSSLAADRIVLRNAKLISGRSVVSFDPDGVRLSGRPPVVLGWDEIGQARLENPSNQERFQALLKQLGDPLYRIRLRLKTGDYRDIAPLAEALLPVYQGRRSDTAYLVFQALFWSKLARNQRAEALGPYIHAVECLRSDTDHDISLPGERQARVNLDTGLSPDLPPVWFDPESAKTALPGVAEALKTVKKPVPPGLLLYAASLAIEAGDTDRADRWMESVAPVEKKTIRDLLVVLRARRALRGGDASAAIKMLGPVSTDPAFSQRPLALYWLGVSRASARDARERRVAVLDWLVLPASYGEEHPELAAAGLYQGWKTLEALDDPGSVALRAELGRKYAPTYFGQKLAAELETRRQAGSETDGAPVRP